jgi:hypothetical protein
VAPLQFEEQFFHPEARRAGGCPARRRQSLKSPAMISGSSRGTCESMRVGERLELPAALLLEQPEVHAQRVQAKAALRGISITPCRMLRLERGNRRR